MLVYCLSTILRYFPRHLQGKHFIQFLISVSKSSRAWGRSYIHVNSATLATVCCDGAHQVEEGWTVREIQADISKMSHGRSGI